MPKTYYGFDDTHVPVGKDVTETRMLEPRTSDKEPFATGHNDIGRYGNKHPNLGELGDRQLKSPKK